MDKSNVKFIATVALPLLVALLVVAIGQFAFAQSEQQPTTLNVTDGNIEIPELPPITLNNLFGDLASTIIFLVLIIAVTFRQSSEFVAKWINGEVAFFERKYIAYALIALTSSLPLGIGLFGEAAKVFLVAYGTWGFIGGLFMVAIYGYGWQHLTNKTASFVGHFITPTKTQGQNPATTESNDQPQQ